jgi:hypothetical protein
VDPLPRSSLKYKAKETFYLEFLPGEILMESLESRMERLTPEQHKEVEDFVDFLLLQNNIRQAPVTISPPPPVLRNTPPILSAEPSPSLQQPPVRMQDLVIRDESHSSAIGADPAPSPVGENTAGGDDWITRDYMDYGKFDQQPSPATEAVKKVKQKNIARGAEEKSRQLLDWVD